MIHSTEQLYQLYLQCSGVSTDTRKINDEALFIALKGPNFNANEYAEQALEKGARYAVVDDASYAKKPDIYLVEDGLLALQQLANFHRKQLEIPVIGITGSNGKTTTKELMEKVLSTRYQTLATSGNLNNHIGVPLTLLSITPEVEVAIVEMGANHVGEIAILSSIANPTHGLITNIGRAHIEGFGGIEGIIRGKSELYQHLLENDGVVFINSTDPILSNMAKRFKNPVLFPEEGDFIHLTNLGSDPFITFLGETGNQIQTQLIGDYNFNNAAAALCVGKFFNVPMDLAEQAVAEYVPANNRSQVMKRGTNTIILDAYNANPSSMKAAITSLKSMDASSKMVILGDMMELGDEAEASHREMIELTRDGVHQSLLCGPQMKAASSVNPQARHFAHKQELMEYLKTQNIQHTTILIKASRSMGLEDVVEAF